MKQTLKIFVLILFGGIFLFTSVLLRPSVAFGEGGAAELININTATVEELGSGALPGIGPVKAKAIVDYRNQYGLFSKIEDIMKVSGIKTATFNDIKDLITVGAVETPPAPVVETPPPPPQTITNNSEIIQTQNELLGYDIGSVVINELVSDPADGEVEFVELYNTTIYSVDLSGWRIEEGSGSKSILGGSILANGFFVLEKPKGNLNNTGDIVKLYDPTGGLIDQVTYGDWDDGNKNNNAPRPDDPLSLARRFDGQDMNNDIDDFVLTEIITKGGSNIIFRKGKEQKDSELQTNLEIKTSTNTEKIILTAPDKNNISVTSSIKISEFLPNPAGSDSLEFIELYNFGDTEINLAGFKLDDEDGGSSPYVIPENTIIKAGEYLVFLNSETKISLNNTGDAARLLDANNIVVEEVPYDDVLEGSSYARNVNDVWSWTATVTAGKKNIIKEVFSGANKAGAKSKALISTTLENLRNESVGSRVRVSGYVAVEPNILGTQYFYIVNDVAGAQIYMYKKDFPDLARGDEVEISGEISEAYSETRVKVANKEDIKKTGKNMEILPQQVEIADIDESLEGSFVQLKGEITELKSSYMYIDDGTDEMKVYFKKDAKIQSKDFVLGDSVEVKGLLGGSKGGFQLLPRSMDDIQKINDAEMLALRSLGEAAGKPKTVAEKYLTVTAGGLTSVLVGLLAKARGRALFAFTRRIGRIALAFVKRGN